MRVASPQWCRPQMSVALQQEARYLIVIGLDPVKLRVALPAADPPDNAINGTFNGSH